MKPILVSIPHASLHIPEELENLLAVAEFDLRTHSDLYTEKIYNIPGVHKIEASAARLLVDPNRFCESQAIDNLIQTGIMSDITPTGEEVYKDRPDEETIMLMLDKHYFPYHRKMEDIVEENDIKFIIDGHSMWSVGPSALKDAGITRSEFILGNRDYATCSNEQTLFIKEYLENLGYQVAINDPYKGKKIMKHHCEDGTTPGIQIEINRKLYLNEETLDPLPGKIELLNEQMAGLVEAIDKSNLF